LFLSTFYSLIFGILITPENSSSWYEVIWGDASWHGPTYPYLLGHGEHQNKTERVIAETGWDGVIEFSVSLSFIGNPAVVALRVDSWSSDWIYNIDLMPAAWEEPYEIPVSAYMLENATLVGTYCTTSYVFEPPSSADYTMTRTSGGSLQTHYGIYSYTSLDIISDMELSGNFEGSYGSWESKDVKLYYDDNDKLILQTGKNVLRLDGEVRSYSYSWEYGDYTGNYPAPSDIAKAGIDDQWNYTYETRVYENGEYEEAHTYEVEITVKDFSTKAVEASTFSTVRVEEIVRKDGLLDAKSIKWRRLTDGKPVYHENYDWKDEEWNLFGKEELKSEEEGPPTSWSEVTRFTGSGTEQYTTDYFTCNHVEWRIRWEYVPHSSYPELTGFNVYTYPQGEDVLFINSIMKTGGQDTNGASYVHNNEGTFYMIINVANTNSYVIIVEQDLTSIPEFPSFIILPLFMIVTLLAAILYRRKHSVPREC